VARAITQKPPHDRATPGVAAAGAWRSGGAGTFVLITTSKVRSEEGRTSIKTASQRYCGVPTHKAAKRLRHKHKAIAQGHLLFRFLLALRARRKCWSLSSFLLQFIFYYQKSSCYEVLHYASPSA
jgi:hypothetical protein